MDDGEAQSGVQLKAIEKVVLSNWQRTKREEDLVKGETGRRESVDAENGRFRVCEGEKEEREGRSVQTETVRRSSDIG